MIEKFIPYEVLKKINNYDRIVVGGIISLKNEMDVLFIKRSKHDFMPDKWEIPSGGIKQGESMFKALKREIKEETNLNIIKIVGYESAVAYIVNNKECLQITFRVFCYGNIKLSTEHSQYIFSDLNNIKDNLDIFMLKVFNIM
ncbi:NUDIX domain-containing protein [Candidatus Pantoea carbekii]|uniref:NUDIX domain-containing protein n=1 Tax=Candidatus Pantoea carbekii TaxID=1235990 RepID=UPI000618762F|nr:NUDIX domain-containing protein [Candidatus Pantoea carbekii]AKC32616.1 putative DNA mismatch repair protein MutT, NUDIX family [Candidatus Pantoea carbekii]